MSKKVKGTVAALSNAETSPTYTLTLWPGGTIEHENSYNSINEWYIEPLMDLKGRQGFLVLMILLPLYETHLKVNGEIKEGGSFSKDHPVFNVMGKDFGLSAHEAHNFWQCFRNGLLHTAIPNESKSFPWSLREHGPRFERANGKFYINPFELRNHLIGIIKADLKKWKRHFAHFPVTHTL